MKTNVWHKLPTEANEVPRKAVKLDAVVIRRLATEQCMYDHLKERPYPDNDGNKHDIEFLPCPFCGAMPHVIPKGNSHTKKRSVTVKCKTCRIERTDAALTQGFDWLYEIAAKNWNERIAVSGRPFLSKLLEPGD